MKDVEIYYYVGGCILVRSQKEGLNNLSKQLRLQPFLLQTMNWSYALGRFLGRTTNISCGIDMC